VRLVIGPYSEEEKAEAKAELDELAALTGNPPAEGESMVERAARGAIMKARAAGEMQGEGAEAPPEGEVARADGQPAVAAQPLAGPAQAVAPAAPVAAKPKAKPATEPGAAAGRSFTLKFAESEGKIAEATEPGESCLIEAIEPTGKIIDVFVIRAGTSTNGKRYRPAVLQEAVQSGVFEGRPSFASEGTDHYGARGVKALCGWWDNARYVEKVSLPNGRVASGVAAHYHPTDRALRETLVESIKGGRPDLIGFSIFGDGPLTPVRESGRMIQDVGKIEVIDSIDPVMHPAAGGQALRLVASEETPVGDNLTPESPDVAKLVEDAVQKVMAPIRATRVFETALAAFPDLPVKARERVMKLAESQPDVTPESAKALIEVEAEYVAAFAPAKVTGAGKTVIEGGQSQHEKLVESVEDVLTGKTHSIRKLYVDLTGDDTFTGKEQTSGRLVESRLAESGIISSTFPLLTQQAMHKRLLAEYSKPGLDNYKKIVSTTGSINDFRTQKLVLMGGYGDLATVAEAGAYLPIDEPTEDAITFPAVTKKGGLEDLTLEAIANDDVRIFRRIPVSLARAAKRTLYKGVWSVLTANGNFPDAANTAIFLAGKGNIGSAALSSTTLAAGRLAMLKQAEVTSAERIGIVPKYLIIPAELEETAYVILNTTKVVGSAYNDQSFVSNLGLDVIRVDHWTDANNWYLAADPGVYDMLEIAFFQGREEPELFLQDSPLMGENFSNDRLTYKIRHIWAVGIADYRPFYGAIVA